MKKRSPGFKSGDHWCICDRCGFAFRQSEMRRQWDGLIVCSQDFETRNTQDFVRGRHEKIAASQPVRPVPPIINTTATADYLGAVVDCAVAGAAIIDWSVPCRDHELPSATFQGGL